MCGITGIVGFTDRTVAERNVAAATRDLRHRGPDAEGFHRDPSAILGHRRLSIIDTQDRSNQPMYSPDGQSVIVFNGEIYNFAELRHELEKEGERFTTTSDTEVLLRLLCRNGLAALSQITGMFAFAWWRPRERTLLLARDRFGEKPLHIAPIGNSLAFASEIPALLQYAGVSRKIDYEALACYLETGFTVAPLTMFRDVRSLMPGQWLMWRDGRVTTGQYYEMRIDASSRLDDEHEATEAVRTALSSAVRRQMVADVPIGALLSGGLDSSAVVAFLQQHSPRPVRTFSVRFEDKQFDEGALARRVARHLGTEHHELTITNKSFREEDLWRIIDHVGVPLYDSSAIPTYVVSRYAREHVTVALSGDGGDEMFGGYEVFQMGSDLERLAAVPQALLRAGAALTRRAEKLHWFVGSSNVRRGRKAFELAEISEQAARFRALHRLFSKADIAKLMNPSVSNASDTVDHLVQLPSEASGWTLLRRMMHTRIRHELANDMLVKVDRMSMAASLEVRAPFLDPEVADVSARLPDRYLIRGRLGKYVLRQAMRPHLPPEVFNHPKHGFTIPLHHFVNADYRDMVADLLGPQGPLRTITRAEQMHCVVNRGVSRIRDDTDISVYQASHQVWAMLLLAAWARRYDVQM